VWDTESTACFEVFIGLLAPGGESKFVEKSLSWHGGASLFAKCEVSVSFSHFRSQSLASRLTAPQLL